MKNLILLCFVFLFSVNTFSQLKGSGKTTTQTFNYTNFDKISLIDIDGTFDVQVGKSFGISVTIDDNLAPLLVVDNNVTNNEVAISLKGNRNNKLYIEDTKIKVKITLPALTAIKNDSNGALNITNITGNYLKIETVDNGSTIASGAISNLEIKNVGNGVLSAENLFAKNAKIQACGNGNAVVNVSELITAKTSGNNSVINIGKAKFGTESKSSGYSRFVNQ